MFYKSYDSNNPHAASAAFIGYFVFRGEIDGQQQTLVFNDNGTFEGGMVKSTLTPVSDGVVQGGKYSAAEDGFQVEFTLKA